MCSPWGTFLACGVCGIQNENAESNGHVMAFVSRLHSFRPFIMPPLTDVSNTHARKAGPLKKQCIDPRKVAAAMSARKKAEVYVWNGSSTDCPGLTFCCPHSVARLACL